jgi:hypothetical protein
MDNPSRPSRKEVRRKYAGIEWRTTGNPNYVKRGITNDFESFEEFRIHAEENGFQSGDHVHRPDRNSSYSTDNCTFLPEDEHRRVSGWEKRKLTANQVSEIRLLHESGLSTWKIAAKYPVSQTVIWRIIKGLSYNDW